MDVEQHGTAGVGVVGGVHHAASEVVDQPGIDGAEHKLTGGRRLSSTAHVIENPFDLGAGEVRVRLEAGLLADSLVHTLMHQSVRDGSGTAALPPDSVINRLAGIAVPHNRGLALVGDADGGDAVGVDAALKLDLHHDGNLRSKDLHGILLHPAGLGVCCAYCARSLRHDAVVLVHDDGTNRRGTRIERHDIATAVRQVHLVDQAQVF